MSIFRGRLDEFLHAIHALNFRLIRKWMKLLSCSLGTSNNYLMSCCNCSNALRVNHDINQ